MSWFPIQALVGFYFFSLPTDVNLLKINIPFVLGGPFLLITHVYLWEQNDSVRRVPGEGLGPLLAGLV